VTRRRDDEPAQRVRACLAQIVRDEVELVDESAEKKAAEEAEAAAVAEVEAAKAAEAKSEG
jgi:predicted outer membrane protein